MGEGEGVSKIIIKCVTSFMDDPLPLKNGTLNYHTSQSAKIRSKFNSHNNRLAKAAKK
jgi:hypothetical protein